MSEVLVFIAATLVTIPLIGLYLVYLIAVKTTRNKLYSFKLAVDCTMLLFVVAVYFIIVEIWDVRLIWLFVLFFFIHRSRVYLSPLAHSRGHTSP
ncbi:MAG: DUF3397 domain-containing protein [Bacillus sp. (in: Bacteria)]|nr:DUF3397 domain-containing protein [Bacillus sp. (in: firmicutes)]